MKFKIGDWFTIDLNDLFGGHCLGVAICRVTKFDSDRNTCKIVYIINSEFFPSLNINFLFTPKDAKKIDEPQIKFYRMLEGL